MSGHHCHARGCVVSTKPEMLMCFRHWKMVPRDLQRAVWSTFRVGQCDDKNPSKEWHEAADAAIGVVAIREGISLRVCEQSALIAAGYELDPSGRLVNGKALFHQPPRG